MYIENTENTNRPSNEVNPTFPSLGNPETIIRHINGLKKREDNFSHDKILDKLLEQIKPLNFKELAYPHVKMLNNRLETLDRESKEGRDILRDLTKLQVSNKQYLVLAIENILNVAKSNNWGLCKNLEFIYLYNGAYWSHIEEDIFQLFLGIAAEKMGVPLHSAKYYQFREQLLKQFLSTAILPTPEIINDRVFINLKNGTLEITTAGAKLRKFNPQDFLTYQLPFEYNKDAETRIFTTYLDRVLPDKQCQQVLAEFAGSLFIRQGSKFIKEEKALVLYGSGANGKSVWFEILNALLGKENISTYSIQSLTDLNGYYRAMIANKLVNYASEMNGRLETAVFKQMVSGEPIDGRLPYGRPMQLSHYAKLIFNCNFLPKDVEHTNAYFRRYIILPFNVTIPENEQDKQLHNKIIEHELPGVLNWILQGLQRLIEQGRFSKCVAAEKALDEYKMESDSVSLYMQEYDYQSSLDSYKTLKSLYPEYRGFCNEDGFIPVNKTNFIKRLRSIGTILERKKIGIVVYLSRAADSMG